MTGADYIAKFKAIYDPRVEPQPAIQDAIVQAFLAGDVPAYFGRERWRPVTVSAAIDGKKRALTYTVSPWLEVGATEPTLFPAEPATYQRIADRYVAILPSRKIVRDAFAAADVKIPLQTPGPPLVIGPGPHTVYPGTPTSDMQAPAAWAEHDRLVRKALAGRSPGDHLVAGHSKNVVVGPNLPSTQLAIYGGWYGSMTPAEGFADGIFWQGYPGPHGSSWVDYSQDAFLVGREATLDGKIVDLVDVFQDPALHVLVSDQGPFVPRYPNAGLPTGGGKVVNIPPPLPPLAPPGGSTVASPINLPNAITLAGYAATIGWLVGGPAWMAIAGLLADEVDGRVARATDTETSFGERFDWATDLTLTGLVASRVGLLPIVPAITVTQVALRERGYRPTVGSARAALTLYALWKG